VGRRAAALLGEVAKTSLRLRQVLRADASSSTVEEQGTPRDAAASADDATKSTKERA